ncbi:MAG: hypothetical protein U0Y82_03455 [Thermoleophilia bacterium]
MAVVLANLIGGGGVQQATPAGGLPRPVQDHVAHAFAQTHWWVMGFAVAAMVPAVILLRVERRLRITAAEVPVSG